MKVKVNGVEIYYQKLGKGHPLILLHGHHQDGGIFDKLVAPLSLYYTVVVPDMRGHGLSEGEAINLFFSIFPCPVNTRCTTFFYCIVFHKCSFLICSS